MSLRARHVASLQRPTDTGKRAPKAVIGVAIAMLGVSTAACGGSGDPLHGATAFANDTAPSSAAAAPQAADGGPMVPQKSFEPAWANVAVGSTCSVAPEGETDPNNTVTVPVDEGGIAHFSAVRATSDADVQRLTLACTGPSGAQSYAIDLRAGGVFIPPPAAAVATTLSVRAPMEGDPMALPAEELIREGFGVRPDPSTNPSGYARWLAATKRPLRKHLPFAAHLPRAGASQHSSRPYSEPAHVVRAASTLTVPLGAATAESFPVVMPDVPSEAGAVAPTSPSPVYCAGMPPSCYWTGAVLSGSYVPSEQQGYALNEATFNVPALVPGGFDAGPTIMSVWTGLDNVWQAIVFVQASPTVASSWIETQPHLTVAADSSPNAGANPTFVPNLNDTIYAQEWYCDAKGNVDLNGGYACSFIEDMQTGDGWSCVEADAPAGECASYKLGASDSVGLQAEFIVENDSPQASVSSDLWPDFSLVAMNGSAEILKNGTTPVGWSAPSTDSNVTLAEDWPPSNLPYLAQEIVKIEGDGSLHWQIAQPQAAVAARASGESDVAYQDADHSLVYMAAAPGSGWTTTTVAPASSAFSAPALVVRPDGSDEADIAVEGSNHSLDFYSNKPGQGWSQTVVAPAGSVYSAPALAVRASGEVDIAFEGPGNTLQYAYCLPGGAWQTLPIAGAGTTFSAPSLQVRDWSNQEVDIAVQGPRFSLAYYSGTAEKGWTSSPVRGKDTTYSAPSLYVRRDGSNRIDVAAQGPAQTLHDYSSSGTGPWGDALVAGNGSTVGAPRLLADGEGRALIAVEGAKNALMFYETADGSPWTQTQVAGALTTYGAPAMVVRPTGEVDVVAPGTDALPNHYVLSPAATSWVTASL